MQTAQIRYQSAPHACMLLLGDSQGARLRQQRGCSRYWRRREVLQTCTYASYSGCSTSGSASSRDLESQKILSPGGQQPFNFVAGTLLLGTLFLGRAAEASTHAEPANALSIPTWMIHISSVIEWTAAMGLMWKYAEVTGNEKWKGMTWGMMPLFAGALSACTFHFFYNAPQLDFLVAIQAGLTWIGNATLWIAAYRIYRDSRATASN